jgi:hypothetical protein
MAELPIHVKRMRERTAVRRVASTSGSTVDVVRLSYGLALLLAPGHVLTEFNAPTGAGPRTVARLLGFRHVGQSLAPALLSPHVALRAGVVLDALHGITDVVVAARRKDWRAAALFDATIASALGARSLLSADG